MTASQAIFINFQTLRDLYESLLNSLLATLGFELSTDWITYTLAGISISFIVINTMVITVVLIRMVITIVIITMLISYNHSCYNYGYNHSCFAIGRVNLAQRMAVNQQCATSLAQTLYT